jgi:streptogramin lyase
MPDFSTSSNGLSHSAIDATGAVYLDYNAASGVGTPQVGRNLLSTGANASGTWPVTPSTSGCSALTDPEQLATLASGDVIVPDYYNGGGTLNGAHSNVFYITAAGVCTQLGSSLEVGFNSPFGAAVDGNDNVFITNRGGSSISVIGERTGTAAGTTAISPYTGYIPQYLSGTTLTNMLSGPLNIAIDPSGNAWVTDYGNNSIVQIIGVAVPATTPLSAAAIPISYTKGSIGYRP